MPDKPPPFQLSSPSVMKDILHVLADGVAIGFGWGAGTVLVFWMASLIGLTEPIARFAAAFVKALA